MDRNSSETYVAVITQLGTTVMIMPIWALINFWCLPAFPHFYKLAHYPERAFLVTTVLIGNSLSHLHQHCLSSAASRHLLQALLPLTASTLVMASAVTPLFWSCYSFWLLTYLHMGFTWLLWWHVVRVTHWKADTLLWWPMLPAGLSKVHIHAGCWR